MRLDPFLYGKDRTEGVVAVECLDDKVQLYLDSGHVEERPADYWVLYSQPVDNHCISLQGAAHYSYAKKFKDKRSFYLEVNKAKDRGIDHSVVYNLAEQYMIKSGVTCHKNQSPASVSVLSFDIETTGLKLDRDAKVLLISCTARRLGEVTRKMFSYDEYDNQKEMINAFCDFVRDFNPSILVGHNIFNFDFPYLAHCGGQLKLARDGSAAKFAKRPSKIRKDGNSFYEYQNVTVHGRQVVDTFNLAIKYDTARNYPSYGLKAIIKHEGLERENRQHYDASTIYKRYTDPVEWKKIKEYATDDGDDALKLFDLMIPTYFYFCQSVPRGLQHVVNSNSGAQVNAFLMRSYLQEGYGIPKADQTIRYEGAISYGNPGVYDNCFKVDVASLYPSIMLQYQIENRDKDPDGHFLQMVERFTTMRLENKAEAKRTGERSFLDRSNAQKIFINSAYGFMNASGLNFNYPKGAERVCKIGRHILIKGINFATRRGLGIVNADTDSFMVHDFSGSKEEFISDLNNLYRDGILWEDDGFFTSVLILKAKNYVLLSEDGKVKQKGAAIKATTKEPALQKFISEVVDALLKGEREYDILTRYNRIARTIHGVSRDTIHEWCTKKTVTNVVLNPSRSQEARIKEAIERAEKTVKEGDKIYVFFETETSLSLEENFNGTYSKTKLATKLHNTIKVFDTVLDISSFPKYHLKRHQEEFKGLCEDTSANNSRLHENAKQISLFEEGART